LRSNRADTILQVPHRRMNRNVGCDLHAAKALKSQPIQQFKLDLFVRMSLQSAACQNLSH
jgi:dUTPase